VRTEPLDGDDELASIMRQARENVRRRHEAKAEPPDPQGIEELAAQQDVPEIEIEIEDPEAVHVGIDGEEILSIEEGENLDDFNKLFLKVRNAGYEIVRRKGRTFYAVALGMTK
jgi:hypothetical protein